MADGTVIVVWGSYGQDGDRQGVYAQRFAENGSKLGGEFRINQYTPNNQRNPVVAPLTNGGFVVAWVSELQRASQSVDVFARLFGSSGSPASDEFPVNLSSSNLCANPSISASIVGGGFAVAWSENQNILLPAFASLTNHVHTNEVGEVEESMKTRWNTNNWDVFARFFSGNGTAVSGEIPLNTTTFGNQFGPEIKGFGDRYVAVWTSKDTHGAREDVFGRLLNPDGSPDGNEFPVNIRTVSRQYQPALASDNHSRLLSCWSSFIELANGFDLVARRFNTTNEVAWEWLTNSLPPVVTPTVTGLPRLNFPTPDQSGEEILPNAFAATAGNYNGLFYDKFGICPATCGSFNALVTSKGAFTGKIFLAGTVYNFRGTFDDSGWASAVIVRKSGAPLTVYLQLDLTGADNIRGGVSDGDFWSDLQADRQVFNRNSNPTLLAGNYTMLMAGATNGPSGESFGTVAVDAAGNVRFNGTLADGTKINQNTTVSKDGYWPFFASYGQGSGIVIGWMGFANKQESDFDGAVVWGRNGLFTNELSFAGSRYVAPPAGTHVLGLTTGSLQFANGDLPSSFDALFTLGANNVVTGEPGLTMSIVTPQGLFKGTVNNANSAGALTFQGAIFQKSNKGGGFSLRNNLSGDVKLIPTP